MVEARADQQPYRAAFELLTTIPGVSNTTARVIFADRQRLESPPNRRLVGLLG
jgi:hypothetical protein